MTSTSSSRPASLEAGGGAGDRADRLRDFAGGQQQRDGVLLDGEQPLQRELARRGRCAGRASRRGRGPGRGRAARARRCGRRSCTRTLAAAVDRDAVPGERVGERLVLEGRAYRQPAAALGRRRRSARATRRRSAGARRPRRPRSARRRCASRSAALLLAHGEGVRVERVALRGVELDQPADRRGARPRERELR